MKERIAARRYQCRACEHEIHPGQSYFKNGHGKIHHRPRCEEAGLKCLLEAEKVSEEAVCACRLPRMINSSIRRSEFDRKCYYCDKAYYFDGENEYAEERAWIYAGGEFVREVWVVPVGEFWEKYTRVEVRFRHSPECPFPSDDPERGSRFEEREEIAFGSLAA